MDSTANNWYCIGYLTVDGHSPVTRAVRTRWPKLCLLDRQEDSKMTRHTMWANSESEALHWRNGLLYCMVCMYVCMSVEEKKRHSIREKKKKKKWMRAEKKRPWYNDKTKKDYKKKWILGDFASLKKIKDRQCRGGGSVCGGRGDEW